MISDILLVVGVGVLSAGLRSFGHPVLFRVGTIGMVLTSFLAGWLIGGSLALGFAFAATWFLLPWLEILTRIRRMRLPIERRLERLAPPPRATFPMFAELTEEIESAGFAYVEDVGWHHEHTRQFFRIFQNEVSRTLGTISFVEQNEFAFYYITLTSRTNDGRVLMTWNYPFSYGLRLPPNFQIQRLTGEKAIEEMVAVHGEFLRREGVSTSGLREPSAETARAEMQLELREQLDHNLACGLLERDGPDLIRYSVRGMFFLWIQFLRDFVRFS
jgi:hypothetical protein